jgi:hypothetical protein
MVMAWLVLLQEAFASSWTPNTPMDCDRDTEDRPGLLYPMLVIAAVAVITFSILGIASIIGWLPAAGSGPTTVESRAETASPDAAAQRVPALLERRLGLTRPAGARLRAS